MATRCWEYWSKEDMDKLVELYPDHTAKECAAILKRSYHGVEEKAQAMGLRKFAIKWTDEMTQLLLEMRHENMGYSFCAGVISREFGVEVSKNACIGRYYRYLGGQK